MPLSLVDRRVGYWFRNGDAGPLPIVGFHPLDLQERLLGGGEFGGIVAAWEEMTIGVGGHLDRGMPEAPLHRLDGQLQAAIRLSVD